jgi:protein SCO1/2
MKSGWLAGGAGALVLVVLAGVALLPRRAPGHDEKVTIGGPFHLIDGKGHAVSDTDFRGKFMLVYFGYTHCPDACPTTLSDLASAIDKLPAADRARLVPLFITVDPERDTPDMMGEYAQAFGPAMVGLTGSAEQIAQAEAEYHVYAKKHPLKHSDYAMDHSSIVYVMGPDGSYRGVIPDNAKPVLMAEMLKNLGV